MLGAVAQGLALGFAVTQGAVLLFFLAGPDAQRALSRLPLGRPMLAAFFIVLALNLLSIAPALGWAVEPGLVLVETVKLCGLGSLLLSTALWVNSRRRARLFFVLTLRVGAAYLVFVMLLYAKAPTELYGVAKFTAENRFTASFISANTAGTLAAVLVLTGAALISRRLQKPQEPDMTPAERWRDHVVKGWPDALALMTAATALLLTGSRTAFVLCLFLLILQLAYYLRQPGAAQRRFLFVSGAILLSALFIVTANIGGLGARFARVTTDAPLRGELFRVHWAAFEQSPWLGYGPGAFEPLNRAAVTADNIELLPTVGAVHNLYLQWLEQAGLVGAGAMAFCLLFLAVTLATGLRRRWAARWTALVLAISALFLLHGFADYALEVPSMSAFWALLLGAGLGVAGAVSPAGRAKARRVRRTYSTASSAPLSKGGASTDSLTGLD